jgi:hypothetical protein
MVFQQNNAAFTLVAEALEFLVNYYLVVSVNGNVLILSTESLKNYTYDHDALPMEWLIYVDPYNSWIKQ